MYAKVFTQILDSSLAENYEIRHVFEDLLKLCDVNGVVDMTLEAIARRTNVPLEIVKRGISELEKPDPRSRNAEHEGRRIIRLDEHRDWGWFITNYTYYRSIASDEQRREKTAERTRRWRGKTKKPCDVPVTDGDACDGSVTHGNACDAMQKQKQKQKYVGAKESHPASGERAWLDELAADEAYREIDVQREHAKMARWCQEHNKQPTRRRFINWLNRVDRPLKATAPEARRGQPI